MASYSQQLLLQAGMLAVHDRRRPLQANLRRSISASYYALFHFLIEEATKLSFGTQRTRAGLRHFAGRSLSHSKMKLVCTEFLKPTPSSKLLRPWWRRLPIAGDGDLRLVADTFVDMQLQRHNADYDLDATVVRSDALNAVANVQSAIDAWRRLLRKQPEIANLFAAALLLWPGLSART